MKRYVPNILTTFRIVIILLALIPTAFSLPFMLLYVAAGITDMLDGFLARKWDAATSFGAKYDSAADFVMVLVCFVKMLPKLALPMSILIWVGGIAVIKLSTPISGKLMGKKELFLHTIANKITGVLLFLAPIALLWLPIEQVGFVLCVVATYAAIEEGHFVRTGKFEREDEKGETISKSI